MPALYLPLVNGDSMETLHVVSVLSEYISECSHGPFLCLYWTFHSVSICSTEESKQPSPNMWQVARFGSVLQLRDTEFACCDQAIQHLCVAIEQHKMSVLHSGNTKFELRSSDTEFVSCICVAIK